MISGDFVRQGVTHSRQFTWVARQPRKNMQQRSEVRVRRDMLELPQRTVYRGSTCTASHHRSKTLSHHSILVNRVINKASHHNKAIHHNNKDTLPNNKVILPSNRATLPNHRVMPHKEQPTHHNRPSSLRLVLPQRNRATRSCNSPVKVRIVKGRCRYIIARSHIYHVHYLSLRRWLQALVGNGLQFQFGMAAVTPVVIVIRWIIAAICSRFGVECLGSSCHRNHRLDASSSGSHWMPSGLGISHTDWPTPNQTTSGTVGRWRVMVVILAWPRWCQNKLNSNFMIL